jgi:hypothetical protein
MLFASITNVIPQDANLLFSTVAQSTAALVAIVGAFVLTESIKSRSQVIELKIREVDLNLEKETKERELEGDRSALFFSNMRRFFRHHIPEYRRFENGNDIDFEKMWDSYQPPDLDPNDKQKIKRTLEDVVTRIYNKAHINPSDKPEPEESIGPGQDYYLFELYVEGMLMEKSPQEVDGNPVQVSYASRELRAVRVKRILELGSQLKSLDKAIAGNRLQILQIEGSRELRRALIILILFGAFGMIYPIAIMTRKPVYGDIFWRDSVLIFFAVGFLSMVAFFWNLIVTSRREPEMPHQ